MTSSSAETGINEDCEDISLELDYIVFIAFILFHFFMYLFMFIVSYHLFIYSAKNS